jgi:mono/diheme cytochrome c family protein
MELATDSQPTGNLAGCSSRKFTLSRWRAGRGKRSPLCVRFTVSIEEAVPEAADQVVEADSLAVIIRTIARMTMQPLPRYGKLRFTDLNGPLRMCMRIPQTRNLDERKITTMPTAENSDIAPKGSPLLSPPEWFRRIRQGFLLAAMLAAIPAFAADPDNGERLARRWCAACHVVASNQRGPVGEAPPFAEIVAKPDFDTAKLAFFLLDPHPTMPNMQLSRTEAADLAAYIATLK